MNAYRSHFCSCLSYILFAEKGFWFALSFEIIFTHLNFPLDYKL